MVRTITVDGKEVTFRASAAIPRMYRMKFRRDIMQDMREIDQATRGRSIPPRLLEAFENMAFLMAKHADPKGVPDTVEAWLDGFETFSIYEIFPIIAELWAVNMETVADSKKNSQQRTGNDNLIVPAAGDTAWHPHPGSGAAVYWHGFGYVYRGLQ